MVEYRGEKFAGYNKPKRTPSHPTKSHAVLVKEGDKIRLIRFGQQGVSGSPMRKGESAEAKKRRASFKARHAANIKRGKMLLHSLFYLKPRFTARSSIINVAVFLFLIY